MWETPILVAVQSLRVRRLVRARRIAVAACAFAATSCYSQDSGQAPGIPEAIAGGRPIVELRPRYNRLDESNYPDLGEGGTMRTTLGWITAPYYGVRVRFEVLNASHIGTRQFNDDGSQINTSPYPLLPDPQYTGVNQAYAEYDNEAGLEVKLGRQAVRLDNQRWVSDNDFRQIPQLFEGGALTYTGIERTELAAAYYSKVRTTSGVTNDLRLITLRAAWNPVEGHSLALYAVMHDQAANGAFTGFADNSYRVVGAKAEGSVAGFKGIDVPYLAEYAQQRPYAGGDSRIDANYWRLGAGLSTDRWTARYDYEVKGSNGGQYGVQMPLTDFYQYNGWTLHFFNTPRQGLHDQWLTLRWAIDPLTLYAESHRFHSGFGGIDFGRENDVGVTWDILGNLAVRLQYARYDPGAGTPDPSIRKTWLTLIYTY